MGTSFLQARNVCTYADRPSAQGELVVIRCPLSSKRTAEPYNPHSWLHWVTVVQCVNRQSHKIKPLLQTGGFDGQFCTTPLQVILVDEVTLHGDGHVNFEPSEQSSSHPVIAWLAWLSFGALSFVLAS